MPFRWPSTRSGSSRSKPTTTARRASLRSTRSRDANAPWPTRAASPRGRPTPTGGSGGRSTGVRRSSSSGSTRSSATWISTAASPKPCAGGAMRSTPRRPTAGWHGSNTRPTGVSPSRARRVCNTGRLRRRPNCTDWRGTTAPRGSTSWPPTIQACGSAASNPTGRPLI